MNFICAVVIYNTKLGLSQTLNNLLKFQYMYNLQIMVLDNSVNKEIQLDNEKQASRLSIHYNSMNGNVGLSKAYNYLLNSLKEEDIKPDDILIWLDDDTDITGDYFSQLLKAANNLTIDIFVPVIIGQDGIMWSPNIGGFLKNKVIHGDLTLLNNSNINAINSCTAVRYRVYKNYRYDERLFLDQVDHKFFYDQRKLKCNFKVIETFVAQSFSQRDAKIDKTSLVPRLKIRFKDIISYGYIMGGRFVAESVLKCIAISFELAIKSNSISILFEGIKLSIKYVFKRGDTA